MKLNKEELYLVKKALRLCVVKFNHRGQKINDIDSRILATKFQKVYEKTKFIEEQVDGGKNDCSDVGCESKPFFNGFTVEVGR